MTITYTPVLADVLARNSYQSIYTAIANTLAEMFTDDPSDRDLDAALAGFKLRYLGCVRVDLPYSDNTIDLAGEMNDNDLDIIRQILNDGNGYTHPIMSVAQCLADTGRKYASGHLDTVVYLYSHESRL